MCNGRSLVVLVSRQCDSFASSFSSAIAESTVVLHTSCRTVQVSITQALPLVEVMQTIA
jgi:hypothetical protein